MATCNAGFLTVSPGVSNPGPPGTVRRRSPTELRPTSGSRPLGHFRVRGRRTPRWPVLDGRVSNLLEVGRECQPLLNGSRQSRAECVRPVQAPLGTSQAGRKDLLFVFFAQDIHRRRIILRLSQCPGSAIPLAAFQVSTGGRFWVSPEAAAPSYWLTNTSICRSFPTVCSGVNIFIGIFSGSFRSSSLYPTGTEIPDGQVTSAYWSKF
jgi:hypothetical protein